MIIVSMMLHSARTGTDSQLVRIHIINDGTGTPQRGNYNYTIYGRKRMIKVGRIENWQREGKTACALLQRVVNHAYPKGAP